MSEQPRSQTPNLQDPADAAAWLRQVWPQTRPPEGANQGFTLMMATAMQTVLSTNETLLNELHSAKNQLQEAEAMPAQREKVVRRGKG